MGSRRSQRGLALAGGVVVAGALGIGVVEWLQFPGGTVWLVVGATVILAAAIRALTAGRS